MVRTIANKPLSIAILAMGGQGGGVLADWIVVAAEASGWQAQSTSVPGVAQRTGATLYYIEMMPEKNGKVPVFALMPTPGDVDIVIAAELMEAGRAILRGLVSPKRTLLITSTHRAYAVSEKEKPGFGIGDPRSVDVASGITARKVIAFDMESLAKASGTNISAPLLGALAGSRALPFGRGAFEWAITAGSRDSANSLKGFSEGLARAGKNELGDVLKQPPKVFQSLPIDAAYPELNELLDRIQKFPAPLHVMIFAGTKRVVDFQDVKYGQEYLARLERLLTADREAGGETKGYEFTRSVAKYLATAMAYDDVIGVADAKTRLSRFKRIRSEMAANTATPIYLTEFMHPRAEELIGLLPAWLGRFVARRPRLVRLIDRLFNRGRRIETTKLRGFLHLYFLAGLRPYRRRLFRHSSEMKQVEDWLAQAVDALATNYGLAVGLIAARRLVKGYSDTHNRGTSKFHRVLSAALLLAPRTDAGEWMSRLIKAALQDEDGKALDGVLETIGTL